MPIPNKMLVKGTQLNMSKTKYLSLCLSLSLLFILNSVSVLAKDNWIRVNSKNFHLVGNASERDVKKVATKLEQFRESFRILFTNTQFDASIPTNVIVFKSNSAYRPFKPKRADGKIDDFVAGYFQPGKDVNYITLATDGDEAYRYQIIFHEYMHFVLNTNFGKSTIPAWFNEGLAEYYETFQIEADQKIKLGIFQQRHIDNLSRTKLMPLDTLFNISNYQLHQQGSHSRSIFYSQSWVLIHYLFQTGKSEGLGKFLNSLISNVKPETAFQEAFQMNYATMEKELNKYVNAHSFKYHIYTLKEKISFESEMKVSPLSDAESNAYLGDLLLHTHRYDDAEPYLQKALAEDPNSSMANTSLGMVKFRQMKFDDAKKYLEKAIETNVKNDQAYYNYAYLLSRESRDEFGYVRRFPDETSKKMRDVLKKAMEINPGFTPSYELYAFISLVNNENLDEGVEYLKTALKQKPGDNDVLMRIAEIWSRQEKFDDAKVLAEKVAKTTDEESTKSRADNLLNQIKNMEEAKAYNENARKQYEERRKEIEDSGGRVVLGRRQSQPTSRQLTPEEVAIKQQEERILSVNKALRPIGDNEKRLLGTISKIACVQKTIVYTVKTDSQTATLFSKDFQNLALVSFDNDSEGVSVECNANLSKNKMVLTYKEIGGKSTHLGELVAIDFVSKDFKFMDDKDLTVFDTTSPSGSPNNVSVGLDEVNDEPTPVGVTGNNQDFDTMRREMMMKAIREQIRQPKDGEARHIGTLEKVECDNNGRYFIMKTASESLKLKINQGLMFRSYVPDIAGMQFDCGMKAFEIPAVFNYKIIADKKTKTVGELVSLEFVPKMFELK